MTAIRRFPFWHHRWIFGLCWMSSPVFQSVQFCITCCQVSGLYRHERERREQVWACPVSRIPKDPQGCTHLNLLSKHKNQAQFLWYSWKQTHTSGCAQFTNEISTSTNSECINAKSDLSGVTCRAGVMHQGTPVWWRRTTLNKDQQRQEGLS